MLLMMMMQLLFVAQDNHSDPAKGRSRGTGLERETLQFYQKPVT
jgi:hypothetical protein